MTGSELATMFAAIVLALPVAGLTVVAVDHVLFWRAWRRSELESRKERGGPA